MDFSFNKITTIGNKITTIGNKITTSSNSDIQNIYFRIRNLSNIQHEVRLPARAVFIAEFFQTHSTHPHSTFQDVSFAIQKPNSMPRPVLQNHDHRGRGQNLKRRLLRRCKPHRQHSPSRHISRTHPQQTQPHPHLRTRLFRDCRTTSASESLRFLSWARSRPNTPPPPLNSNSSS